MKWPECVERWREADELTRHTIAEDARFEAESAREAQRYQDSDALQAAADCLEWLAHPEPAAVCGSAEVAKHAGPWSSHGALGDAADEVCDWIAGHDVEPDSTGAFMSARLLAAGYLRALRTTQLRPAAEVRAEVERPVRESLCAAGYCGDGDLSRCVERALGEAELFGETKFARVIEEVGWLVDEAAPDNEGDLTDRVGFALASVQAEARREALEEAARVCDEYSGDYYMEGCGPDFARRIRALARKGEP